MTYLTFQGNLFLYPHDLWVYNDLGIYNILTMFILGSLLNMDFAQFLYAHRI